MAERACILHVFIWFCLAELLGGYARTSIHFNMVRCGDTMPNVRLKGNKTMPTHSGLSICFWMNVEDIGISTVCSVATKGDPESILVQIHPRLKRIRAKVLDDESFFYYQTPRRRWVHVCIFWFRSGDMNLFIDGKFYDVDVPTDYQVRTRNGLDGQRIRVVLGEAQTTFDGNKFEAYKNFKGSLFDVRIFNRTLFGQNEAVATCKHLDGEIVDSSIDGVWKNYCTHVGPRPPCIRK